MILEILFVVLVLGFLLLFKKLEREFFALGALYGELLESVEALPKKVSEQFLHETISALDIEVGKEIEELKSERRGALEKDWNSNVGV